VTWCSAKLIEVFSRRIAANCYGQQTRKVERTVARPLPIYLLRVIRHLLAKPINVTIEPARRLQLEALSRLLCAPTKIRLGTSSGLAATRRYVATQLRAKYARTRDAVIVFADESSRSREIAFSLSARRSVPPCVHARALFQAPDRATATEKQWRAYHDRILRRDRGGIWSQQRVCNATGSGGESTESLVIRPDPRNDF